MTRPFHLLPLVALCVAPAAGFADPQEDLCHARARAETGLRGPETMPSGDGLRMDLNGSLALGASKSSGAGTVAPAPPFAGAAAAQRFEDKRAREKAETYRRVFQDCMGRR